MLSLRCWVRVMAFDSIGRRKVITLLGSVALAAVVLPLPLGAQQTGKPVIGLFSLASFAPMENYVAGFHRGLKESGFVDGQNVSIEYRSAENQYDRLPTLAADLVRRRVAVIVTLGGDPTAFAAKAATTTIPIVFSTGSDPVKAGLVASLNRPGGNATGVNIFIFTAELGAKRLGLLHDVLPSSSSAAILVNPNFPPAALNGKDAETPAGMRGKKVTILNASTDAEIDAALSAMAQSRASLLVVAGDPFFNSRRERIAALAAKHAISAIYEFREFAAARGLMSYGTSLVEGYRQEGLYAGKTLKGAKPSDLPVTQLTKFEFVINLKTAKALGLTIPSGVLSIADEVIE
jgi:ABC-type uncharacterized transport system substrate-binding protein